MMKYLFSAFFLLVFVISVRSQGVGINQTSPVSMLDVNGGVTIGSGYSGTNAAPANGVLIEGKVGIGTTSPNAQLHIENESDAHDQFYIVKHSSSASWRAQIELQKSRGTAAAPTTVLANDILGAINSWGYDGSGFETSSAIHFRAGQNIGAGDMPGNIRFLTRPEGGGGLLTRMVVDDDGAVGIGTSAPIGDEGDLTLGDTGGTQGRFYFYGSTAGKYSRIMTTNGNLHIDADVGGDAQHIYLNYYTGNHVYFGDGNGSAHSVFSSAGRLGIGSVSPATELDVAGDASITGGINLGSGTGASAGIIYADNGSGRAIFGNTGSDYVDVRANNIYFRQGGAWTVHSSTTAFVPYTHDELDLGADAKRWQDLYSIDGYYSGLVSIGTTSSVGLLTVQGDRTSSRGDHITVQGTTNTNLKGYFGIDTDAATPHLAINFVEETVLWRDIALANMGGNVGIGTISPAEKLHVAGSVRGNSTGGALRISTGNGYVDVGPQNSSWSHFTTDRAKYYFNTDIHVNGAIGSYNTQDLSLHTGGTTRMTIDNSTGYVGISSTSPGAPLDVNGASILGGDVTLEGGSDALIFNGWATIGSVDGNGRFSIYENAETAGGIYMQSEEAHRITMHTTGISFYNAPSGTAGNAITWELIGTFKDETLDMNSHNITNVADPTSNQDAATKAYVDAASSSCAGTFHRSTTTGAQCADATSQCGAGYHLCMILEIEGRSLDGNALKDQDGTDATYHWIYEANTSGTKVVRGAKYDYSTNTWSTSSLACGSTWNIYSICCSD